MPKASNMGGKEMKNGMSYVLIFGGILMLIGYLLLTKWARPILNDAQASKTWPTVTGIIEGSSVESHRNKEGSTTYSARILYKYTVDDHVHRSERVWFGDNYSSSGRSQYEKIVAKYPVNKEVTVYYKPDDPFEAVLEPGAFISTYVGFIVSWVLIGIGGTLLTIPMRAIFQKSEKTASAETFSIDEN